MCEYGYCPINTVLLCSMRCNSCMCSLIGSVIMSTECIDTLLYWQWSEAPGPRWQVTITEASQCRDQVWHRPGDTPVLNIPLTLSLTLCVVDKFKVLVDLQTSESTSKLARKINNLFNLSDLLWKFEWVSSAYSDLLIKKIHQTFKHVQGVADPKVTDTSPRVSGVTFRD